jgi:hypothetical protein
MADEQTGPEEVREAPMNDFMRRWLIRFAVLALAFLLGLVPMWWAKSNVAYDLDQAKREIRRGQIENLLSAAALYARRGEYETGRQNASSFFTELQAELNKADSSVFTAPEGTQLSSLLGGRDDVITLLSRNDPAAADRLSDMYVAYRAVTGVKPPQ